MFLWDKPGTRADTRFNKKESTHLYTVAYNMTDGYSNIPLIGFVNLSKGKHQGAEVGFINTSIGQFKGGQVGFINTAASKVTGGQGGLLKYNSR